MKLRVGNLAALVCLAAILGVGCASTTLESVPKKEHAPESGLNTDLVSPRWEPVPEKKPEPEPRRFYESLSFNPEVEVPELTSLRNERDPREWVEFGLSLSERGRHHAAGEIFEGAAQRFSSRGRTFEVRCLAAAANEFKDSGDVEKFRDCLRQLRQTADRFQLLGAGHELSVLMALGDVASGKVGSREWYPQEVKELIRANRKSISKE